MAKLEKIAGKRLNNNIEELHQLRQKIETSSQLIVLAVNRDNPALVSEHWSHLAILKGWHL